jgi:outer membrane protein assembly factor BamB
MSVEFCANGWRRVFRLVSAFVLGVGVLAAGCSSNKEPERPLPTLKEPTSARQLWVSTIGKGGVGFAPTLVNGQLFAAASDGTVARFNAANGQVVFRTSLGKTLSAGVGSDGDSSVVIARDGELIALNGTGVIKWRLPLKLDSSTPPAVALGTVVVRSSDNRVVALDLETGKLRWNFQRVAPSLVLRQASGIAITSGTAIVGLSGGRLVALGLNDGVLRWEVPVSQARGASDIDRLGDVVGTPLVIGREVCAVAVNGNLMCLDGANGRVIWSRAMSSNVGLDIDPRTSVTTLDDATVQANNRANGNVVWAQASLKGRGLTAPVIAGSGVLLGDKTGLIHILSLNDGATLARLSTDGSSIVSQPVALGRQAYVQTSAGGIYAFELQ